MDPYIMLSSAGHLLLLCSHFLLDWKYLIIHFLIKSSITLRCFQGLFCSHFISWEQRLFKCQKLIYADFWISKKISQILRSFSYIMMSLCHIHSFYKMFSFFLFECIATCSYSFASEILAVWQGETFSCYHNQLVFGTYTEFKEHMS